MEKRKGASSMVYNQDPMMEDNLRATTATKEDTDPTNRIIRVVQVADGEKKNLHQSLGKPTLLTSIAQSARASAVILQPGYVPQLHPLTEGYPLACLPIANKPLLGHQIKYLEANGLFDIYVVVHKEAQSKVEKYLKEHFDPDVRSSVYLVVVLDEETGSGTALKMIA